MILSLQKISPVFLKSDSSDVWNKAIEFQDQNILITAPSGTGKTSLFNILYLIDQNFEGQYALNEKEAKTHTKTEIASIRKNKISAVFQNYHGFDELSLMENIEIKNQLTNYFNASEIERLLGLLGLADKKDQITANLSYGQRQRLSFLCALCQPFKWLIMDEPFSHLDTLNIKIIHSILVEELKQRNANMILLSLEQDYQLPFDKTYQL